MPILGVIASSRLAKPFLSGISYQQSVYINGSTFASKVSWANGAFRALVMVPVRGGTTSRCIFSSTNGDTWTLTASGVTASLNDTSNGWVWYTSAGYYISSDGANTGSILYSTDLINWTSKVIDASATTIWSYGDVSPSNGMWFAANNGRNAWINSGNPTGTFSSGSFAVNQPNALTWAGGSNWVCSFSASGPTTQGIYQATSIGGSFTRISGNVPYGIGRRKNAGLLIGTQGGTQYYYSTNGGSGWNTSTGSYATGFAMDDDSSGTSFTAPSYQSYINTYNTGGSYSASSIGITGVKTQLGSVKLAASSSDPRVFHISPQTYILSTNSGSSWTAKQAIAGTAYGTFAGIGYLSTKFVVLKNVNNTAYMLTSTDGNTWTETDISSTYLLTPNNLTVTGGYVYSQNSNNSIFIYNGTSWTNLSTPSGSYGTLVTGFASNGSVTIVGDAGGRIHAQTSIPSGGFTTNSGVVGTYISTVAYGNGIFVAGDNSGGNVITSTTGTGSWTVRATGGSGAVWVSFSSKAGLFIARAGSSTTYYTSPDGITWTARNHTAGNAANFYQSTVDGIIGYGSGYIITSTDGITWANSITGVSNGTLANEMPSFIYSYNTTGIATNGAGEYRMINDDLPMIIKQA